ncbi:hypothetical protein ACF0H5_007648 [Mactra antiquata]
MGKTMLQFSIGGQKLNYEFIVVSDMTKNVILGKDFMFDYGVRIYCDLKRIRIGKTYVPLESDIHIHSLVRLKKETILKPRTVYQVEAKMQNNTTVSPSIYEVSQLNEGFIDNEPGLQIRSCLITAEPNKKFTILLENHTGKTIRLYKNAIVAKAEPISEVDIISMTGQEHDNKPNEGKYKLTDLKCPDKYLPQITSLLDDNLDILSSSDRDLGQTNTVKCKIDTGNSPPIKTKTYFTPLKNRQIIDEAVKDMLEAKIIQRSNSPWSSPVVIVTKKDGGKRFCVDFRKVNQVTKKNSWPLPRIDEILAQLGNGKFFSTLDLRAGYWQVELDSSSREVSAFSTSTGLYEFLKMPFGLANAPSVFQELMSIVLEECREFAFAYLDDIIIFSPTVDEHLRHIQIIFDKLRTHNLKLKIQKCTFLQHETNYLGYVISDKGIKACPEKVKTIREMAAPKTTREARSYLGLIGYYRRLIPSFSTIAAPIIALTRKYSRFKWTPECEESFKTLNRDLTKVPYVAYPDINKGYIIYTDASNDCIAAVLAQECDPEDRILPNIPNERPIFFASHKLSSSQQNFSTIEKECFAVKYFLEKFDPYIHGSKVVLYTDHQPLTYLMSSPMANKRLQKWSLSLSNYDLTIKYIAGRDNRCADMLSRIRHPPLSPQEEAKIEDCEEINDNAYQINLINTTQMDTRQFVSVIDDEPRDNFERPTFDDVTLNMTTEQERDDGLNTIKNQLTMTDPPNAVNKYVLLNNVIYYLTDMDNDPVLRLCIPTHLQSDVLKRYHEELKHMGADKCYDTIKQKYFWKNMYKSILEFISKCVVCNMRANSQQKPHVNDTEIPVHAFAKCSMDITGPLPETLSGNRYILVFMCCLTGWVEAFAIKRKTAENIAHLLIDEIFNRYSSPRVLLSDNGSEMVNEVVKYVTNELNIAKIETSFYSPNSNGKVERFNATLKDILSKTTEENMWDCGLNAAVAAYRFSPCTSTGFSPFYLLYGREPEFPVDSILRPRRRYYGDEDHKIMLQTQHKAFRAAYQNMKKAKQKQSRLANRDTTEVTYDIGQAVFLKNNTRKSKLDHKYLPYYRIVEKKSPLTFVLKNVLDGKVVHAHARNMKSANIDDWEFNDMPPNKLGRQAKYAIPPASSSSNSDDSDINDPENIQRNQLRRERTDSSESDVNPPPVQELQKKLRRRRFNEQSQESDSSDSEDDLARLRKQIQSKRNKTKLRPPSSMQVGSASDVTSESSSETSDEMSMDINHLRTTRRRRSKTADKRSCNKISAEKRAGGSAKSKSVKTLLNALADLM